MSSARTWIEALRLSTSCELTPFRDERCGGRRGRPGVAGENLEERLEGLDGVRTLEDPAHRGLEAGDAVVHALEISAELFAVGVAFVGGESLRGIGEQELVATFDGVNALLEQVQRVGGGMRAYFVETLTTQRSGSWCSRYCRRVIVPNIIALVIHSFSGRSAK